MKRIRAVAREGVQAGGGREEARWIDVTFHRRSVFQSGRASEIKGKLKNDEQQASVCGSHRRSPGVKEERNENHEASGESRTAREEEGPSLAVRRRGRERVHVCHNERERERGLCHWYIKRAAVSNNAVIRRDRRHSYRPTLR